MNRISGRVVLKESGAGIPDVLVVIYDLDPGTKPEESITPTPPLSLPPEPFATADRLCGVLTKRDGSFEVLFEDSEFQVRNADGGERRPDLVLQVLAPEDSTERTPPTVLFTSPAIRQNAGKIEEYLIRITADELRKAGIPVPSLLDQEDTEPAEGRIERLRESDKRSREILDGALNVARERVDAHRTRFIGFQQKLQNALSASLSTVSPNLLQPERLVKEGESPFQKSTLVITNNIRDIVNSDDPTKRAPARGFISLTDDEIELLRAQAGPDGTVPESAIKAVAASNAPDRPTTFLQRTDLLPLCRPKTPGAGDCLSMLEDTPPAEDPASPGSGGPATEPEPVTPGDIPKFIGRLIAPLTAPEEQLVTGLTPTATLESIQHSVQDLSFQPSPADVPAFHDFHQLQIAFQHVWQELIDRGVLDLAENAYETIVELGGDPIRPEYDAMHPFRAIKAEAGFALRAVRSTPPPAVRDHRNGDSDPSTASGGVVVRDSSAGEATVRDHRGTTAADPVVRLPAVLKALEDRLKEKYAFTIFAANAQERSVNFGILNTFRQVWTPLSYQAGPLVKSIPLAPKQTQKVVVTRKIAKKRQQKEVENNLRVIKEETSQTSRAEQEIAKRASAKTEFSYSNSATGGVEGVGSNTATTTFKQDAAKSSDDVKKAFRESVFKSAQEFKNERTTEITTETTEELETSETTEISNPNDEIAVTFLFYELQRRYRLHERLHRVTPVVLVAQEVPAPHEIDEAWLIAHDWILKRSILDDSFIPTLETLSQSAGAETALAQLAANVSQQRQIVAQLREELAIARRVADLQNGLIHEAVGRRTGSSGLLGSLVSGVAGAVGGVVEGAVDKVGDLLFGGGSDDNTANREALRDNADEAADRARELTFRLEREVTALNSITETYAKALQAHHTHLTEIARLRVHVKENILHYMQAIWRHEPPDQRFFRLHNVPIPTLNKLDPKYQIQFDAPIRGSTVLPHMALERFGGRQAKTYPVEARCKFPERLEFKPLCEVADLDNLLGFKGNYMIFPLLESNALTDFMMEPYIDRATGELVDPADPVGWSLDEFARYVCCLKEQLTAEELEQLRPRLKELYQTILTSPRRNDDVLIVPTDSLFIEALPASHSLIERFKKDHRMIDVKRAQSEVRENELRNILRAARILEGEREDPQVDKKVVIAGAANPVVEA